MTNEEKEKREYEFAKFAIKTTMTAQEIKDAVMEDHYTFASENLDEVWDLIVYKHETQKMSDEDYLEIYMTHIYEEKTLRDQLYKEATNGADE